MLRLLKTIFGQKNIEVMSMSKCEFCGSENVVQLLRFQNGDIIIDKFYCDEHKTKRVDTYAI